jgi:hypothetical protein
MLHAAFVLSSEVLTKRLASENSRYTDEIFFEARGGE